jgi:hypothetical protein
MGSVVVNINPNVRIVSDQHQWTVQRRRIVKGRDKWDSLSYHGTLDGAVWKLAQAQVRMLGGEYGPEALTPLCQALDSLRREIRDALKGARWLDGDH